MRFRGGGVMAGGRCAAPAARRGVAEGEGPTEVGGAGAIFFKWLVLGLDPEEEDVERPPLLAVFRALGLYLKCSKKCQ